MRAEQKKTRIDLDSNVFRNQDFINWLIINREALSINISIIVYLETFFWYLTRSQTLEDFEFDLKEIKADITPFDQLLARQTAKQGMKSDLPFKYHARDFIIGSTTLLEESILLTYNLRHFKWMPKESVMTPEEFIEKIIQ